MNEIQILSMTICYALVMGVYYGAKNIYFLNQENNEKSNY